MGQYKLHPHPAPREPHHRRQRGRRQKGTRHCGHPRLFHSVADHARNRAKRPRRRPRRPAASVSATNQTMNLPRHQQADCGFAVIIALVAVTVLSIMAGALALSMKVETQLAVNSNDEEKLLWVAR